MENYIPLKSEYGSLEHGLYKLIEVWTIYQKNSKYNLLWHNVTVNKNHVITALYYVYYLILIITNKFKTKEA